MLKSNHKENKNLCQKVKKSLETNKQYNILINYNEFDDKRKIGDIKHFPPAIKE